MRIEIVLEIGDLAAKALDFLFGVVAVGGEAQQFLDVTLERVNFLLAFLYLLVHFQSSSLAHSAYFCITMASGPQIPRMRSSKSGSTWTLRADSSLASVPSSLNRSNSTRQRPGRLAIS